MTRLSDLAIRLASEGTGLTPDQLISHSRERRLIFPRYAAVTALNRLGLSTVSIGRALFRDHTTILHGLRNFDQKAPSSMKLLAHDIEVELRRAVDAGDDAPAHPADTLVAA